MARHRVIAGVALGAGFGFLLSWGQLSNPDRIRDMLILDDPYIYEIMAAAIAVGFVGLRVLRRLGARALLTGEPVRWVVESPRSKHVIGGALFGVGWAISDACPGPIIVQMSQGVGYGFATFAGVLIGVMLHLRTRDRFAPDVVGAGD